MVGRECADRLKTIDRKIKGIISFQSYCKSPSSNGNHGHCTCKPNVYKVDKGIVRSEDAEVTFDADLERLAISYAVTFKP